MLDPEYLEHCADTVIEHYIRLERAIIKAMVRRILKMGFVSESTKHEAEMLQHAGLLYDDIMRIIAEETDGTVTAVKTMFEDAGTETVEIDNEAYRENGLSPVDIRQSEHMRQILEAGCRKTYGVMENLTLTTANTVQQSFFTACNDAYMQITSGAFSYQEALRNVIRSAALGGLEVLYPSGHKDKLDVAVRRAALTGVGQTCAEISLRNAEEMDCDLMELSAHSGARPTHAVWQGQLVSLSGKNAGRTIDGLRVLSLSDIGYGSGNGFKGWNCRHDWYPYFEGVSAPNYTQEAIEELNARNIEYNGKMYTEYEITQMQRTYERKIRELKRQTAKMQDVMDFTDDTKLKRMAEADYRAAAVKLKNAEQDLKDFCKVTKQDRDRFREQVLGFSRSEAQRAVHAYKKALTKTSQNGIINMGSDKLMIRAIETPIEQTHTGKGNPNAILTFGIDLNNRQKKLLENLMSYNSRITVAKSEANMADLSALTAHTGHEFAMFTKGHERLIIRGSATMVEIDIASAKELAKLGYRFSGHTHPGIDFLCMQPSDGDYAVLGCFNQKNSVIYNSKGDFRTFEKRSD